jgi:1,4-dihydroxy-2-naphthoyl-CoA hydrolase
MTSKTDLDALTRSIPFAAHLGLILKRADAEGALVEVVLKPEYCTLGDTAHGGFLMALADYTGAAAAVVNLPAGSNGTTTIESKTNMMGKAPVGARLRAIASRVHVGRRTSVWLTRVETEDGRLISLTSQTQMVL